MFKLRSGISWIAELLLRGILICTLAACYAPIQTQQAQQITIPPIIRTTTSKPLQELTSGSKYTLLHFWSPWCVICKPELRALQKISPTLKEHQIQIITVSSTAPEIRSIRAAQELHVSLPLYIDEDGSFAKKLRAGSLPTTVLFDSSGKRLLLMDPETKSMERIIEGPRKWDSQVGLQSILESIHDS